MGRILYTALHAMGRVDKPSRAHLSESECLVLDLYPIRMYSCSSVLGEQIGPRQQQASL